MTTEDRGRCSRWIMRAMEWNEPRARYPNIWHEGMPRHIMAFDTVARRLRLGDLVAIFHPASAKHPERSKKFVGISRVVGLRVAEAEGYGWIDLETAHRLEPALESDDAPRRVFLCCDEGWPDADRALFTRVFDAAVAGGWQPSAAERGEAPPPSEAEAKPSDATPTPGGKNRVFAGVDYSGDMRDPRDATWLAIVELRGERLHVVRLEATGRHGLHSHLRDPDTVLMSAEAIGLDFPFGLPLPFAERILDGPFPDEGWWALARRFERLSRPDYLVAIQEFRDAQGEPKRWTDERARTFSPLHRVNPDLGPMTFHGIRMIAEERSRYAVKPFESAQGRLLLEVYPGATTRQLQLDTNGGKVPRREAIVRALDGLDHLPVTIAEPHRRWCATKRDALDAVIAARSAADAVLSGETDKAVDALSRDQSDRVRLEGWIYGVPAYEAEAEQAPAEQAKESDSR